MVQLAAPIKASLVIVHMRSGLKLEDKRKGKNIQEKRRRQAQTLRDWMLQQNQQPVLVVGDFNSAFGDEIYQQPIEILQQPPFASAWQRLPEQERFSYIYQCRPQAIDNILYSDVLAERVLKVAVIRGHAGDQYRLYKKPAPSLVSDQ